MINLLFCNDSSQEIEKLRGQSLGFSSDLINEVILFKKEDCLFFYLEEHSPEPSILMIQIAFAENGIEIAKRAKEINPWVEIIFVCYKDKWTPEIYEVEHAYCLEYPFTRERIENSIDHAIEKTEEKQITLLPIKKNGATIALPVNEIIYFEQERRILHVHTEMETHSVYLKFSDITKYRTDYFLRCHNSYAVNLFFVKCMTDVYFEMKNGIKIPISRSRKHEVKTTYEAFITGEIIITSTS